VKMSDQFHGFILENSMELVEDLWLPYRLLQLCSWDLALGKYNSHDIECWMPSRDSYGETHSATSFLDFQARRLNLRYRAEDWTIKYCYTLNNTVVASPRILISLIECNQTADWKIKIPACLQEYMWKDIIG
jgi:seryl-tRNA synthetase